MKLDVPDLLTDDGDHLVIGQIGFRTVSAVNDPEQSVDHFKIGNRRQQDDNLIAVSNALRLSDCWRQLAGIFEQNELKEHDYVPKQLAMYKAMRGEVENAESIAWVKACIMADKATASMRHAISTGQLLIWRMHDAREIQFVPLVLDRDSIKHGIFKSFERPEPDAQGALLWAKSKDWDNFLRTFMTVPAVVVPIREVLPPDDKIRDQMIELCAAGMSRDEAAKHIRTVPGFGRVQNEHARGVVRGILPRGRRTKAKIKAREK